MKNREPLIASWSDLLIATLFWVALILAALLVVGCSSLSTIRENRASGTTETFSAPPGIAYSAAKGVLLAEGFKIVEDSPDYISAEYDIQRLLASGSYAAVWIEPQGSGCRVTCRTERKEALSVTTGLTETTFFRLLGKRIK